MGIIECWLLVLGLFSGQEQAEGATENFARRGTAEQSSTFSDQWPADLAIDGGKDFSSSSSTCASTRWENEVWWRLDLQSAYPASIVVVTFRIDSFPGTMKPVHVFFGNSHEIYGSDNHKCTLISSDQITSTNTYSCGELKGRYIIIFGWLTILSLCEVEVYETESTRRSFMKLAFKSSTNLTDPTVMDQVLKELTSALAVRGVTNVSLSWSQTPKEEVIERQVENDPC